MAVEASIILEFGDVDETTAGISIEIDEEFSGNLDSDGNVKSSFSPNDTPVFLIHHSNLVRIAAVKSTDGIVSMLGTDLPRIRDSEALFTTEDTEINLGYSNPSSLSVEWRGSTTAVTLNGSNVIATSSETFPCVCDTTFQVVFNEQWMLTPPSMTLSDDESYIIYVVVYVENV